jgi:hypothetical protein
VPADEQSPSTRGRGSGIHPARIGGRPHPSPGLASKQTLDAWANQALDLRSMCSCLGRPALAIRVLRDDQVGERLVASSLEMSLGGFRSTLEVAAAPARLCQVGKRLTVELPRSGHLLELGAREGEQAATQVEPCQAGIDRSAGWLA